MRSYELNYLFYRTYGNIKYDVYFVREGNKALKNKGFMKIPGFISSLFLIFYSIFRFLIEFVRVPDEHLGYLIIDLTMGQIISIIFLLIGIYLLITKNKNENA